MDNKTDNIFTRCKLLAETLEDIAFVSDRENTGPMYTGQHIRSGIVKIDTECADILRQGAIDISLLISRLDSHYADTERLWQWARENLSGDIAEQFWQIAANGHLMTENPEYHQRINILKHELEETEAKLIEKGIE